MKKIPNFQEEVTGFKNENKRSLFVSIHKGTRHFGAVQQSSTQDNALDNVIVH